MKRDTWFIPFVLFVSLLLSSVILLDLSPLVRGPGQWRWSLLPWPDRQVILFSIGSFLLFIAAWYIIGRRLPTHPSRRQAWLIRGILLLLALLIQAWLLLFYRPHPAEILFERLASNRAAGYFTAAQEIEDLPTFLRQYPELMPTIGSSSHVRTKPPGILLIYWSTDEIMKIMPSLSAPLGDWWREMDCSDQRIIDLPDSALASITVIGLLTPLISALAIWPAYGIASRRWGSLAGWIAAGLVALIPARLAFTPQMDTVYPFLSLMAFYLADTGLRRRESIWFLGAGILISIASFMSPINFVIAALIGFYIIYIFFRDKQDPFPTDLFFKNLLLFGAGVGTIWIFYWIIFGVSIIDIAQAIQQDDIPQGRGYWFWLVGNLVDFYLLAGLPVLILASSWPFLYKHSKFPRAVSALAISFWLVLLLLNFSGIIRAETGRVWLMLAPFPAILASIWIVYVTYKPGLNSHVQGTRTLNWSLLILIATATISLVIGLRWQVTEVEQPRLFKCNVLSPTPPVENRFAAPIGENASYEQAAAIARVVNECGWNGFTVGRPFHGTIYEIIVSNPDWVSIGIRAVEVVGRARSGNVLAIFEDGEAHLVEVIMG